MWHGQWADLNLAAHLEVTVKLINFFLSSVFKVLLIDHVFVFLGEKVW